MNKKSKDVVKNSFPYIILFVVIIGTMFFLNMSQNKVNELTYNELIKEMNKDNVKEISITGKTGANVYIVKGKLDDYKSKETFSAQVPYSESVMNKLLTYADEQGFKVSTESNPENNSFVTILVNVLPLLLLVGITFYLFSRLAGSNNKSMDFGRSRAKLSEDGGKCRFADVAGLKEEKEEVEELIDFLKNPKKFQKLGARIPKGVMLVGPPGTGKTLLARAVAGEANVPFFYISGSDFVELFVGVGASRVRDMFKQAKQNAPCLIFIDEIDAVGRQRGTGLGGGHDEREQTLNQLLTEMDGFGENEGIIIIAATNRPDVLDPALLRPGRFDRQVMVNLPDQAEREAILGVHAKNKTFLDSVNLKNVSYRTPGFSGADLENLLNEAALLTVRRNKNAISMDEIDEATDRVLMGPAKTSRKITSKEKKMTAYHESGHAVVGIKLKDAEEVHKITIIPRGMAGGYTMSLPKEEKVAIYTKKELLCQIAGLLAGRASEELFLGEITTGASNDFKRATRLARSMVTEYGMSDLGLMQLEDPNESVFLGRDYAKSTSFSDKIAHEIDIEVKKIIEESYEQAKKILIDNKKLVDIISDALIKYETLTKEQIDSLVKTGKVIEVEDFTLTELKELAKEKGIKGISKMTKEELKSALENVD